MYGKNIIIITGGTTDIVIPEGATVYFNNTKYAIKSGCGLLVERGIDLICDKDYAMTLSDFGCKVVGHILKKAGKTIKVEYSEESIRSGNIIVPTYCDGDDIGYIRLDMIDDKFMVARVKNKSEASVLLDKEWFGIIKDMVIKTVDLGVVIGEDRVNSKEYCRLMARIKGGLASTNKDDKKCDVILSETLTPTGLSIFNLAEGLSKHGYYENCKDIERLDNANQDIKLLEEMNELSQAVLKRMIHKSVKYENVADKYKDDINSEIADVIITLLGFIKRNNINPDTIVEHMNEKLIKFTGLIHELKVKRGEITTTDKGEI